MRFWALRFWGSCFGLGLSPWAPGTVGTLGGVLLASLLPNDLALAAAAVVVFMVGLLLAAKLPGSQAHGDPGWFVLDEVAAYTLLPLGLGRGWVVLVAAFVFFRLFDITKPPPIKRIEMIGRGWGVMLDDLLAAAYAYPFVHLVLWLA